MAEVRIDEADALKIFDALTEAGAFLQRRDEMNARVHLARETRYSPLTTTVIAARDRLDELIEREAQTT